MADHDLPNPSAAIQISGSRPRKHNGDTIRHRLERRGGRPRTVHGHHVPHTTNQGVDMTEQQYDSATIKAFEQMSTASVSDALQSLGTHGYLSSEINLVTGSKVVGPAVTVREIPTTESVPPTHALEAIDAAASGDVMVIVVGAERDVAVWGGLMTAGAVANGLAGVVLDAGVRDVEEINRDCEGVTGL